MRTWLVIAALAIAWLAKFVHDANKAEIDTTNGQWVDPVDWFRR